MLGRSHYAFTFEKKLVLEVVVAAPVVAAVERGSPLVVIERVWPGSQAHGHVKPTDVLTHVEGVALGEILSKMRLELPRDFLLLVGWLRSRPRPLTIEFDAFRGREIAAMRRDAEHRHWLRVLLQMRSRARRSFAARHDALRAAERRERERVKRLFEADILNGIPTVQSQRNTNPNVSFPTEACAGLASSRARAAAAAQASHAQQAAAAHQRAGAEERPHTHKSPEQQPALVSPTFHAAQASPSAQNSVSSQHSSQQPKSAASASQQQAAAAHQRAGAEERPHKSPEQQPVLVSPTFHAAQASPSAHNSVSSQHSSQQPKSAASASQQPPKSAEERPVSHGAHKSEEQQPVLVSSVYAALPVPLSVHELRARLEQGLEEGELLQLVAIMRSRVACARLVLADERLAAKRRVAGQLAVLDEERSRLETLRLEVEAQRVAMRASPASPARSNRPAFRPAGILRDPPQKKNDIKPHAQPPKSDRKLAKCYQSVSQPRHRLDPTLDADVLLYPTKDPRDLAIT